MMTIFTRLSRGARPTLLLLACVALASGCVAEPARAAPSAPVRAVRAVRAERSERPALMEVMGTVRALRSTTIAALISGSVAELRVSLGSSVRAGEPLIRLSAREVDARLEQARAQSALAAPERDRAAQLRQLGAISAAQYDEAIAHWSGAQAREAEASAIAQYTLLRAPFAGVVSEKLANIGDSAMPGQPLLVLESGSAFRFEARVPESMALRGVALGHSVPLRLDGVEGEILGTIAEIQPTSDDATRTRLVKLDLPRLTGLRAGRFGRLLLPTAASSAVSIPAAALVRRGQLECVFVVEAGAAQLRLIRSARERGGRLEIASGLTGHEQVVVDGASELADGQRVQVLP